MSFEQEKKRLTVLPISSEAEALRQAALLSMRPNRREITQQHENQEEMTILVHPQQNDVTQQEESTLVMQNDRNTTPPRRSRSEERAKTPENKILDTKGVLARQRSFSPEEGEYIESSEKNSDDSDSQSYIIPRTNPFNIMQAVANGTNYERTAGNLFNRYFEESPGMTWVFNGTIVGRPPMEVDFDDDTDAEEDENIRTYIRRCCRVSTPCPRSEDLTPSNYILNYVETLEASQNNNDDDDRMQVDSEEQTSENGGVTSNITSDRKGDDSISSIVILNSPNHGPDTVDGTIDNNSNNNSANISSDISGEVSPMLDSIDQICEVPPNTANTLGDSGGVNQASDDPPGTVHTNGDVQISGVVNQISGGFSPSLVRSTDDVQMDGDVNQISNDFSPVLHTIDDVQCAGDFSQMSDHFSPVPTQSDGTSASNVNDNAHRLTDDIVNTIERSARTNDIPTREIRSPFEEGEIEEGEIVESEIAFEDHVAQIKNTDEETRELMKELYEYGALPIDIIEEGIPIDVVVRFTRELNHRLPPELEVFSVASQNEQVSSPTQMNPISTIVEPVIKLEPVEDNLPTTDNFDQRGNSLTSKMVTSSQAGQNFIPVDKPFMTTREQNFIIDLSDSSDGEHRISGLLQETKSSLPINGTQIDAKRRLEEKEREIKRMNELIASKTELLRKKSITTTQQASTNTGTSIDIIRAALESFETAKSQVSEVKSRLSEEEKRLENIRSEMTDTNIKADKNSSLAKQYLEQMKSCDTQKDQMLQKREEIECLIRTQQDELFKVQSQIDDLDKEKETAAIELTKKEEEYTQQLRTREQHLEQEEKKAIENVTQFKKQLGPMLKDMKAKKEQLSQMVAQSTKPRNESTMAGSSTSVLSKNGKKRVYEQEMAQEDTPKRPKLALEVAELSKKIEQVSKEQQSLRESLEKKRQGDTEMAITTRKSQKSCSENEWRAEKIASQETISEDKFEVFKPYESPLKGFRSFRFHPEYVGVIRDIKSFTFNNHIVPNKKMCAFELQPRGICNDDDCRSQHFRDLPMTENDIIDNLAGYYEGENFAQQRLYREGLNKLLNDLEMTGRNTFLEKFEEIKKYRDTFIARSQNDGTGAPRVVFTNGHRPLANDWYNSPPICESESDYVSESLPTPRMPTSTSLSSEQDDDQQQIYPTSPELEEEDEDGDYFSPSSAPRHKEEDNDENVKYESYDEEVESDDQFVELSESESSDSESVTFEKDKEDNLDEQDDSGAVTLTEFVSTNHDEVGRQERQQEQSEQQEEQAYAPFGYVGRIINWFL